MRKQALVVLAVLFLVSCSTLPLSGPLAEKKSAEQTTLKAPVYELPPKVSPMAPLLVTPPSIALPQHYLLTPTHAPWKLTLPLPPSAQPFQPPLLPLKPPATAPGASLPATSVSPANGVLPTPSPSVTPHQKDASWVPAQPAQPVPAAPIPEAVPSLLPSTPQASGDVKPQDITAHAGEDVFVQFAKTNWIYLDPSRQQKEVGFLESRREAKGTSFLFRPQKVGEWSLVFQRQDLTTGQAESRLVRLHVLPRAARPSETLAGASIQSAPNDKPTPEEKASVQATQGNVPPAVQTLLQNYSAEDTQANWKIGSLLAQNGQPQEALVYLRRNLGKESPQRAASLELATRLALADPKDDLETLLPYWVKFHQVPQETLFLDVLSALKKFHRPEDGLDWAAYYPTWYPIPTARDRWLFLKASLLEEPGSQQDPIQAWRLYRTLVNDYPLSSYWMKAGERSAALDRQILDVR